MRGCPYKKLGILDLGAPQPMSNDWIQVVPYTGFGNLMISEFIIHNEDKTSLRASKKSVRSNIFWTQANLK